MICVLVIMHTIWLLSRVVIVTVVASRMQTNSNDDFAFVLQLRFSVRVICKKNRNKTMLSDGNTACMGKQTHLVVQLYNTRCECVTVQLQRLKKRSQII